MTKIELQERLEELNRKCGECSRQIYMNDEEYAILEKALYRP